MQKSKQSQDLTWPSTSLGISWIPMTDISMGGRWWEWMVERHAGVHEPMIAGAAAVASFLHWFLSVILHLSFPIIWCRQGTWGFGGPGGSDPFQNVTKNLTQACLFAQSKQFPGPRLQTRPFYELLLVWFLGIPRDPCEMSLKFLNIFTAVWDPFSWVALELAEMAEIINLDRIHWTRSNWLEAWRHCYFFHHLEARWNGRSDMICFSFSPFPLPWITTRHSSPITRGAGLQASLPGMPAWSPLAGIPGTWVEFWKDLQSIPSISSSYWVPGHYAYRMVSCPRLFPKNQRRGAPRLTHGKMPKEALWRRSEVKCWIVN